MRVAVDEPGVVPGGHLQDGRLGVGDEGAVYGRDRVHSLLPTDANFERAQACAPAHALVNAVWGPSVSAASRDRA